MLLPAAAPAAAERRRGFNLIASPAHPLGSEAAARACAAMRRIGADTVALVPFLWQSHPADPQIIRGADTSDDDLAAGIRQARAAGLRVLLKPHVWVPESWAGAVEMREEAHWQLWFRRYATAIARLAEVAQAAGAEAFAIGTELARCSHREEWEMVIAAARAAFGGALTYVAHNAEEAQRVPFWTSLDAIGASLYPVLGPADEEAAWVAPMRREAETLAGLAARLAKPVWVCEIGLRSAAGATERPWESAEERAAEPDEELQARVLARWWQELDRPGIGMVLIWRWLTDPAAGGPRDTDFTVQGKQAELLLARLWRGG
ncbi:MAG: hypothetical protein RMK64_03090 [Rhodovarius sp.]|nr:hypothetical protein [Rhodovarius sp.]MDW8313934.1 hypothetical protein [Rhodovarius sp.]